MKLEGLTTSLPSLVRRRAPAKGSLSAAQGGKFMHGFVSGAASSFAGDITSSSDYSAAQKVFIGAAIGGTASYVSGGKFINGAVTGAFVVLFNHLMHEGDPIDEDIRLNGRMYYSLDVARAMAIKITDQTGDETRILTLSCENNISYFLDAFYNSNSYSATWNSDESLKNGGYTILCEEHFSCGFDSKSRYLIVSRQDWMNSRSSGHPITHTSLGIGSWHCLPNDPFGMPSFTPAKLFNSMSLQSAYNRRNTINFLTGWTQN